MILYVAASWNSRDKVRELIKQLHGAGFTVTSRWPDQEPGAQRSDCARNDVADIVAADALLRVHYLPSVSGGMYWETGFAWGQGKKIFVVGVRHGVFDYLPGVEFFDSVTDFINAKAS